MAHRQHIASVCSGRTIQVPLWLRRSCGRPSTLQLLIWPVASFQNITYGICDELSSGAGSWLGPVLEYGIRGSGYANSRVSRFTRPACKIYRGSELHEKNARRVCATSDLFSGFRVLALRGTAWAQKAPIGRTDRQRVMVLIVGQNRGIATPSTGPSPLNLANSPGRDLEPKPNESL